MTNSNLSCIPFYRSLDEQDFRKWYAYGDKFPFYVPSDYLIPFFFPIPLRGSSQTISSVQFYKLCGDDGGGVGSFNTAFSNSFEVNAPRGTCVNYAFRPVATSYASKMVQNGLTILQIPYGEVIPANAFNIVAYYAKLTSDLQLEKGIYYMAITLTGDGTYYSDVFYVDSRAALSARTVRLEWRNTTNVEYEGGLIPYGIMHDNMAYWNTLFIETEIAKPTYNFTEEGEERNGYFFPIKQISDKSFNMGFYAPEYMCDVMRLIRMADTVYIADRLARNYVVEQFEMDVDWLDQGHYASVDCTFKTDTIIKKVGKAY